MRALALSTLIFLAPVAALAGPAFGFNIDLRVNTQQQLTTACLIAAATSGPAPSSDPKTVVEWCARAAAHLFTLYPRVDPSKPREKPPELD